MTQKGSFRLPFLFCTHVFLWNYTVVLFDIEQSSLVDWRTGIIATVVRFSLLIKKINAMW